MLPRVNGEALHGDDGGGGGDSVVVFPAMLVLGESRAVIHEGRGEWGVCHGG